MERWMTMMLLEVISKACEIGVSETKPSVGMNHGAQCSQAYEHAMASCPRSAHAFLYAVWEIISGQHGLRLSCLPEARQYIGLTKARKAPA
jgi:hypothetical protein